MDREYCLYRSQLKGYLFEIIVLELLRKNNFHEVQVAREPPDRVREIRPGFIEFKGRGCWHQIDCPCDYSQLIPFMHPIRLLGEVKYYKTPLEKRHIREYIGVIKDIQENYFVADGVSPQEFYPRKTEIGVYFSASGFQEEAEKIAYAHGIKTVSYANNPLIDRLKKLIDELERNCISVQCLKNHTWNTFRQSFIEALRYHVPMDYQPYLANGYEKVVEDIRDAINRIRSSFIATTATGVFLHFVGDAPFPAELFELSDEGRCRVYYNYDNFRNRYFWLELAEDVQRRRFYFSPPESLDHAAVFGNEIVLNEKERVFRILNVNIQINGISRSLILHLDEGWLDAVRRAL